MKTSTATQLALVLPFLLIGCNYPMKGVMNVNSVMKVNDKHGKAFQLVPGTSDVDVRSATPFVHTKLYFKLKDSEGKERVVRFKLPSDVRIPKSEGTFALSSDQTDQSFDIRGTVRTDVTHSEQIKKIIDCSIGYYYYYYGKREIVYHTEYSQYNVDAQFLNPGSEQQLATFHGGHTTERLVYDHYGHCHY